MQSYHCVHIWNIEPNAREEITGGVHHENWVFEKAEVQHLAQNFSVCLEAANIGLFSLCF